MKPPKGQILWVTYKDTKGKEKWAITSDEARLKYNLYNLEGEKPVKLKTGKSPAEFEKEVGTV